jgi:hypothetical protein
MGFGQSIEERVGTIRDTIKTVSRDMAREESRISKAIAAERIHADNAQFVGDYEGQRDHLTRLVELRRRMRRYTALKGRMERELMLVDTQRVNMNIYQTNDAMHSVLASLYGDTDSAAFKTSLQKHMALLETAATRRDMIETAIGDSIDDGDADDDLDVADEVERLMKEEEDKGLSNLPNVVPARRQSLTSVKAFLQKNE